MRKTKNNWGCFNMLLFLILDICGNFSSILGKIFLNFHNIPQKALLCNTNLLMLQKLKYHKNHIFFFYVLKSPQQRLLCLATYFIFSHQLISNNNIRKLINPHLRMPQILEFSFFFSLLSQQRFHFKFVMAQN